MKPLHTSVLVAVGATLILAAYTVEQWVAPSLPLTLGAAAVLPLAVVAMLAIHPELRDGGWKAAGFWVALAGAAVVAVGIPASWALPKVRVQALGTLDRPTSTERALDDPNQQVQIEACRMMLQRVETAGVLSHTLVERPALAAKCLTTYPNAPQSELVTSNLETSWHGQLLMASEPKKANSCLKAQGLAALPLDAGVKQAHLLDCALRSPSAPKRQCCVDSLKAQAPSCQSLARSVSADTLVADGTPGTLLAAAYEESTARRRLAKVLQSLDLTCPPMKMIAVQLACSSMGGGDDGGAASTSLSWLFNQNRKCLDSRQIEESAGLDTICERITASIRRERSLEKHALCQAHREALRVEQRELARLKGLQAKGADLARRISSGHSKAQRGKGSLAGVSGAFQGFKGGPQGVSKARDMKGMLGDLNGKAMREQMREQAIDPADAVDNTMKGFESSIAKYKALKDHPKFKQMIEQSNAGEQLGKVDQTIEKTADQRKDLGKKVKQNWSDKNKEK